MARKPRPKAKSRNKEDLDFLTHALEHNGVAKTSRKQKSWTKHDIKAVRPITDAQEDLFHSWNNNHSICAHGSAGTGKTFLALYLALNAVLNGEHDRIVIVRSVVPTREMGFLPGDLDEKTAVYEEPYKAILFELFGKRSSYDDMKDAGKIEFMSTSFIRGLTIDNAIIILDESSNNTFHEISSVVTRVGENTRVICTGDIVQSDLNSRRGEEEGMSKAMKVFEKMVEFSLVRFTTADIVRSEFVKSFIIAEEAA